MTDQNMVKGDIVYPNHFVAREIGVKAALVFLKGELATVDANGFLEKLTADKIKGLLQVRNAITGGVADGDVTETVNDIGSRILLSMPVNAKKGDKVKINAADGTGNVVVAAAADSVISLVIGTVFALYKNTGLVAGAGDLGLVDVGVY